MVARWECCEKKLTKILKYHENRAKEIFDEINFEFTFYQVRFNIIAVENQNSKIHMRATPSVFLFVHNFFFLV